MEQDSPQERNRIFNYALSARTLPEIERAEAELRAFQRRHPFPHDFGSGDIGESLSYARDFAEQQQELGIPVRSIMKYARDKEREALWDRAVRSGTSAKVATAECELKAWFAAHPDDIDIVDPFESVTLIGDVLKDEPCVTQAVETDAEHRYQNYCFDAERQEAVRVARDAMTLWQVEEAEAGLKAWREKQPDDPLLPLLFGYLNYRREHQKPVILSRSVEQEPIAA